MGKVLFSVCLSTEVGGGPGLVPSLVSGLVLRSSAGWLVQCQVRCGYPSPKSGKGGLVWCQVQFSGPVGGQGWGTLVPGSGGPPDI